MRSNPATRHLTKGVLMSGSVSLTKDPSANWTRRDARFISKAMQSIAEETKGKFLNRVKRPTQRPQTAPKAP